MFDRSSGPVFAVNPVEILAEQVPCPQCGRSRRYKDSRDIVVRNVLGGLCLPSSRLVALRLPTLTPTPGRDV